mgnify:FL=1
MQKHKIEPWPYYEEDEIDASTAVMRSGLVNYRTGKEGLKFEEEFANYSSTKHALTVTNGTAALELALEALEVGKGDEVIVPSRTFIATASAVARRGAKAVVADIDIYSQNISIESIIKVFSQKTRVIIPVHLAGWPVDLDPIIEFANDNKIYVIEDCAQAHGASYKNKKVGSIGHIGCFSFCQDKIISTGGEGGMIITNNKNLYKRMWSIRDHGWDYNKSQNIDLTPGFKWMVENFGSNYRMTEFQSAIGRAQLKKLDLWVDRRIKNAEFYNNALISQNIIDPLTPPDYVKHSYYKYNILLKDNKLSKILDRDLIMQELINKQIPARVGSCPDISKEKAFSKADFSSNTPKPNTELIANQTITLPTHHTLSEKSLDYIIKNFNKCILEQNY